MLTNKLRSQFISKPGKGGDHREVREECFSCSELQSPTDADLQHRSSSNWVPAERAQLEEDDGNNSGKDGRRIKKLSQQTEGPHKSVLKL